MGCDLYFVAGEKSGDLHGEKLVQALFLRHPNLRLAGVGGPRMRAAGLSCTTPMESFQVMGFIDVLFALPKLMRQFYKVAREILTLNPKVVVTIDYPGMNLRLARYLKKKGFKGECIHFICPSVWAWGKKRIPLMEKYLDRLLTILPFESQLFSSLKTDYVGHPLIERIRTHVYQPLQLPKERTIVALFSGSRQKEIERNLPLHLKTAQELLKEHPDLHFALSLSDEKFRPLVEEILASQNWSEGPSLTLVPSDRSYELMKAASFAIAKSGTVTLELALHAVPTVVTYAISALDVIIAYHLLRIRLPHYCLVNIIAEKQLFPELFGPHFTKERLKQEVEKLLKPETQAQVKNACLELIEKMGTHQTAEKVAEALWKN